MNIKYDSIKISTTFKISAEELFSAWLDTHKHSAMTGSLAKMSKKIGNKFEAWDGYITGENIDIEQNKRVVQSWRTSDFPPGNKNSRLEILFEEGKGKTKITLIHTDIPKGQGKNYKKGWKDFYFTPMKAFFREK